MKKSSFRLLMFALLIVLAITTGDWLAKTHSWWVFDMPSRSPITPEVNPQDYTANSQAADGIPAQLELVQVPLLEFVARDLVTPPSSPTPIQLSSLNSITELAPVVKIENIGPIAVIRSRHLLKLVGGKPSDGELERLRNALIVLGNRVHHPVTIIDADGMMISSSNFVVYAKPEHDITSLVSEIMNEKPNDLLVGK